MEKCEKCGGVCKEYKNPAKPPYSVHYDRCQRCGATRNYGDAKKKIEDIEAF